MMGAGAAIRQFFVLRHGFKLGRNRHPWPYALVGVAVVLALIVWLRPGAPNAVSAINSVAVTAMDTRAKATFGYETVQPVLEKRCYLCHGAGVQMKNVRLDSPAAVAQHAQAIYQQAAITQTMPMNNATHITPAERSVLKSWYEAGAKTR
jgi:uncharacterized membrane protein